MDLIMTDNQVKWSLDEQALGKVFGPEVDQKVRTQLLVKLIICQTIAVTALTLMMWVGGLWIPGSGLSALLPLGLVAAIVGGASYWLVRRNRSRLGGHVFLIGTCVAITFNVFIRGYQDASAIYYLWPILGAMMVLEVRDGVIVAVVSTVLYLMLVFVQRLGYQTPALPYDPQTEALLTVGSRVVMIFLLTFLAWLSNRSLSRYLRETHRAIQGQGELNEALEQRAIAERKQREQLRTVIAEYMTFVSGIAMGDLTTRLTPVGDGWRDDPLIVLGYDLNEMADNLCALTVRMREVAQSLSASAAEILAVTQQQASGAGGQSAAVAQTITTVDDLKAIAEQSVARAQEVAGASQRTVEVSRAGQRAVEDTIGSMVEIKAQVEGIAEHIVSLVGQTQRIGGIIATVNDIAAQSHMLALNASMEAARAGGYGRGFAVVAEEVRNLAEQSRQATAQVRAILSEIHKATTATVTVMEEGARRADDGVQLAVQAGVAIGQLAEVIEESAQSATQMVAGGQQQSAGVEQVAAAMQSINQAMLQSLDSTRQAEKAAQELHGLACGLAEVVEQYRL
jgi:methyl-accepting chemotaxis protein